MNQMHPAAKWSYRLRNYFYLFIGEFIIFFVCAYISFPWGLIFFFFVFFLPGIIYIEISIYFKYRNYCYEITNEGISFQKGFFFKTVKLVSYKDIRSVSVEREFLSHFFDYSVIRIEYPYGISFDRGKGFLGALSSVKRKMREEKLFLSAEDTEKISKYLYSVLKKNNPAFNFISKLFYKFD